MTKQKTNKNLFPNYKEWYFNYAPIEEKHFHIMLGFWSEYIYA